MQSSKKIWGIFNTLDKEKLDGLNEFDVWMKIYLLNNDINFALNYSKNPWNKDISVKAVLEEQFNLEYLIYYTKKFGVEFEKSPTYGVHVDRTDSFNMWYNFWLDHFNSMAYNDYKNYIKDRNTGVDISSYLPIDSWKNVSKSKEKSIQLEKAYQ